MALTSDERIAVMKLFLKTIGEDAAAQFVCDLEDSVDKLRRNNAAYVEAYKKFLSAAPGAAEVKP